VRVAYESRTGFAILNFALVRTGHFKVEHAYSEALLALVSATVAGTHHYAHAGFLLPSQVNHRVRNRRVALNGIGAGPEQQIARFQIIKFE